LKFLVQGRKHPGSSEGIDFHAAVAQVLCVARYAQLASHAARKIAKSYTLHLSADAVATSLVRFSAFMDGTFGHCERQILSEAQVHPSLKYLRIPVAGEQPFPPREPSV
jgi:hypothetical protein